jgi:hypothetical protein
MNVEKVFHNPHFSVDNNIISYESGFPQPLIVITIKNKKKYYYYIKKKLWKNFRLRKSKKFLIFRKNRFL